MLINKLIEGSIFLKHGSHGSPHYRYIWCSSDLSIVNWSDLYKKKIHGSIYTNTITNVQQGHTTKIMMERAPKTSDPNKCFSLLSSQRTLDLECISNVDRDIWVTYACIITLKRSYCYISIR